MSEWISVKTKKPKLGQKCYCWYVTERHDGSVIKEERLLYYLKYMYDKRKMVFSDKHELWLDQKIGCVSWPVTHWQPLPTPPETE